MTLDESLDRFEKTPNKPNAGSVSDLAAQYYDDEMIAESTYDAIMKKVRPYLDRAKSI